ncbi:MAG: efflux RND transporter permease subunit [Desulfobacterales bacterium]|nr:efflux RND transporter permease subunit [Desulfobacterales bacterium]
MNTKKGIAGKTAEYFIDSKLTPLIIIASILLGIASVIALPREEEPQIIVPMVDVFVKMPGASSKEVEQRVTSPMEKLLWEIPGVEYVYSTSSPGMSMAIVRFYVGQNEEEAIVRLQSKLMSNMDRIPWAASQPLIKPRYIDDVPILALTFWSNDFDHYMLRRVAAEVENIAKRENNVSITNIIGGGGRQVDINIDPVRLAAFGLDLMKVSGIVQAANYESDVGEFPSGEGQISIHAGSFLKDIHDIESIVVGLSNGRPVYLRDVAKVKDGQREPDNYVFFGTGPAAGEKGIDKKGLQKEIFPAVTITVAKRKGTNAISVAEKILNRIENSRGTIIPDNLNMTITRHYGETAREKSNELLYHMMIAVVSVTLLIWFTLGRRESGVVALAIPVTLALTLSVFYIYGYTLNRITLFALIFSIGILVDDAIVIVENIVRHFRLPENNDRPAMEVAIEAVDEVGNPTILATLTVICAILPMAFVGGLMGPYMRPIPVGASAAMIFSLIVAFIITPWASIRLIKSSSTGDPGDHEKEGWSTLLYRRIMSPLINNPRWRLLFLMIVVLLLTLSCLMVLFGLVKVKMLPFDNKSEFQVIIDMPESATLEETASASMEMGEYLKTVNEVTDYEIYVGTSGPFNFNGLVRHYFLREGTNVADIQVNLAEKKHRKDQSHDIAKRVRPHLVKIAEKYNARVKVAEVPPGPPVLSTIVAEVYGPDYNRQREIALNIIKVFEETPGVVDVDWHMEDENQIYDFEVDREKASLHGLNVEGIVHTIELALSGRQVGLLHQPVEKEDVPIIIQLPLTARAGIKRLETIKVSAADGSLVPLSTLVTPVMRANDRSIYHKNLMPVVHVIGDVAGVTESPVYAILEMRKKIDSISLPEGYKIKQYDSAIPESDRKYSMKWDGEWHITFEVFRDMGIAFAVVLVLIFVLVVGWFQSFTTPVVIMVAIPFSLIGILPAHWMADAFFTATSMIGFIAGAGIVVRNSIILVDFIELRLDEGIPLEQAVVDAGAIRFRPMMLTAAAVVVGASVILFDPIFQGLAISLMAGEIASLLFSRMTVPILYYMNIKRLHVK